MAVGHGWPQAMLVSKSVSSPGALGRICCVYLWRCSMHSTQEPPQPLLRGRGLLFTLNLESPCHHHEGKAFKNLNKIIVFEVKR